jgi:4-amino-4-deoxychorismate lyase
MNMNLPLITVNGVLGAQISPMDRGFAYGDGVFETCRVHCGKITFWALHLERLLTSAERLKIPIAEAQLLTYRDELLQLLSTAQLESAVLKITITRGVGGRGYGLPQQVAPTYCLGVFPSLPLLSDQYLQGVAVRICSQRLSQSPALAGMKHMNRLEHILARSEWGDEFNEGLLLDVQGNVIEATVSNLFLVNDGCLITPDLTLAGVAGIMRRLIIERFAPELGLNVVIRSVDIDVIGGAQELFLCNSVFGIWPVVHLATAPMLPSTPGAVTRSLQHCLTESFK